MCVCACFIAIIWCIPLSGQTQMWGAASRFCPCFPYRWFVSFEPFWPMWDAKIFKSMQNKSCETCLLFSWLVVALTRPIFWCRFTCIIAILISLILSASACVISQGCKSQNINRCTIRNLNVAFASARPHCCLSWHMFDSVTWIGTALRVDGTWLSLQTWHWSVGWAATRSDGPAEVAKFGKWW